jgi:hypothetical protein
MYVCVCVCMCVCMCVWYVCVCVCVYVCVCILFSVIANECANDFPYVLCAEFQNQQANSYAICIANYSICVMRPDVCYPCSMLQALCSVMCVAPFDVNLTLYALCRAQLAKCAARYVMHTE